MRAGIFRGTPESVIELQTSAAGAERRGWIT
jgi:hypothetical protein